MVFSKKFPRDIETSNFPVWEEVWLNDEEEKEVEKIARREHNAMMRTSLEDAKKISEDMGLKQYQSDVVSLAVSLFEKRASHTVYHKERRCKEKFDKKFKK